ncbi:O-methyltransferase [Piscirickettsia litoralis]|uniref:SAM-dependent methyltransferase n=1 Tax=Piscirickettsia litoralis TaxID=1891921 RepID=A0ABX2ZZV1_9GAMM|nr:class I SAM-dependent methyltransferase [Piscirickettsia litoralis]ODN41919.1 SAM-dependent methyltransferase [Piscirickettsia litoralis]
MIGSSLAFTAQLQDYLISRSVNDSAIKRQLREYTAQHVDKNLQISPEQGQFLAVIAMLIGAQRIIEIGTFTGYSSLCLAETLPENGQLISCDVSEEWTEIAKTYWEKAGVSDKIDLRLAPATETLQQLISESETINESEAFDLVFIDADKINSQVYYELALQLVRQGGVIIIDNVLWGGKVMDESITDERTIAIREFNDSIIHDQRVKVTMLPLGDGMTLVYKY